MSFVKNAIELVSSPTHSRTTAILIILLILAVVPLTVFISQQQQEIRQRAAIPGENICSSINRERPCAGSDDQLISVFQSPCSKGDRCKYNNIVYECKEQ